MGKDDAEHQRERPTWAHAVSSLWGLRTGAAMLAIGIVLLSAGMVKVFRWSQAPGKIVSVTLPGEQDRSLIIRYAFAVDGGSFAGIASAEERQRYEFDHLMALRGARSVTVWYDRRNPNESMLLKQPLGFGWVYILLGLAPVLAGGNALWGWALNRGAHPMFLHEGTYLFAFMPGILLLLCVNAILTGGATFWLSLGAVVFAALGAGVFLRGLPGERTEHGGAEALPPDSPFRGASDTRRITDLMMPAAQSWAVLIAVITWGMLALLMVAVLAAWHARERRAAGYEPIAARVLTSQIVRDPVTQRNRLDFRYSYRVDAAEYFATRYDFTGYSGDDFLKRVTAEYPPGRQITAYYDPANPTDAVVQRSRPEIYLITLLMIQPLLGLGLIVVPWLGRLLWRRRSMSSFLYVTPRLPMRIWLWGPVLATPRGFAIAHDEKAGRPLVAGAMAYGIVCFAAGAALGAAGAGAGGASASAAQAWAPVAFYAAGALGLLAFLWQAWRVVAAEHNTLELCPARNSLTISGRNTYDQAAIGDIDAVVLRPEDGGHVTLLVRTRDGRELTLHRFIKRRLMGGLFPLRVAERAGEIVVALMSRVAVPIIRETSEVVPVLACDLLEETEADDDPLD